MRKKKNNKLLKFFNKHKSFFKFILCFLVVLFVILVVNFLLYTYDYYTGRRTITMRLPFVISDEYKEFSFEAKAEEESVFKEIVYEDMTKEQVIEQIDKSLSSTLEGTGSVFVEKSLERGVDPYVAVAISLYETGCKWGCSSLVRDCYNLGGLKGSPSCNGTSFKKYDSLEEGIDAYINVIASYYRYGMNTPEKMERRYTGGSTTWASKVNAYIKSIKSK